MAIRFSVVEENNKITFLTDAEGNDVIRAPLLNKGTGFTIEERNSLKLNGLIPPRILNLEQHIDKVYQKYKRLGEPFEKCISCDKFSSSEFSSIKKMIDITRFNFLRDLHDRNEILFYAFCFNYMQDVIPIIYTPTVGDAVMRYSRDSARFRGIFLSPNNIDKADKIFNQFRYKHPTIAVVTDNQGILGLGDQGVGGIDIPIGKLSLYVLGAGVRPWETMPLTLDVGTDNKGDLSDPYYLGYKSGRLKGKDYDFFIQGFIESIKSKFPNILIQWEDFSRQNAFTILDRYRYSILSFNDDIQGTGSVALAGIINALKITKKELNDQKFVIYGAGAGGVGIARRISACLQIKYNISKDIANSKIAILDSKGLVTDKHEVEGYKRPFIKNKNVYDNWEINNDLKITLDEVIKNFEATVLIGTSGCPGHFTDEIILSMTKNTDRPIIFPLSNPTTNCETTPQKIYQISKGKAIVATGSPFGSFDYKGQTFTVGQGNNFYIFPGVGFGAILSKGNYISDPVFTNAAYKLADMIPVSLLKNGCVYPSIKNIREISAQLAYVTMQQISEDQGTDLLTIDEIKSRMWKPQYHPIVRVS